MIHCPTRNRPTRFADPRCVVDDELVMKFESELQMEKEMSESEELPVDIKDYLDSSPFEACPTRASTPIRPY